VHRGQAQHPSFARERSFRDRHLAQRLWHVISREQFSAKAHQPLVRIFGERVDGNTVVSPGGAFGAHTFPRRTECAFAGYLTE
jgi:hypothetical protein